MNLSAHTLLHPSRTKAMAGVSVLELVIAAGIIAVLLAMAFPAFRITRERMETTACLQNLRTIGIAIQVYAGEHNGILPKGDVASPGGLLFWPAPLAPYLNIEYPRTLNNLELLRKSPLFCPAEKAPNGFHYAMNRELNERLYGERATIRLSELSAPASYALVSDAYIDRTIFTDLRSKMLTMTRMTRRHGETPNFLYADFHAEPFREPIYGVSDAEGRTPFYRALWRARYPND